MFLLLLLAACPLPQKPVEDDDDVDLGGCLAMCLAFEEGVLGVLDEADPGHGITHESYVADCEFSDGSACEDCYRYIQDVFLRDHGVTLDCGCGLTVPDVRECMQDPEMSEADAQATLDNCDDGCDAYGL